MKFPCQKLFGLFAKLTQFACVLALAGFLFAPKAAQAQYGGGVTMTVIGNALNGSLADIGILNAALGSPPAPYDVNAFLQGIRQAFGDLPSPAPATNSAAIFLSAGSGNTADMLTIQNTLTGAAGPVTPANSGSAYFNNYFQYLDPYGFPVWPVLYPNGYDDLINWAISGGGTGTGTANQQYQTLLAALGGNAGAIGTLSTVLFGTPPGNWSLFQTLLCNQFGSCANAINQINLALGGDTTAQGAVSQFLAALIQSNSSSGAFDAEGVAFMTALGFAGGGGGNCLIDTDGDTVPDCNDPDIDGDGIPNQYDTDQNGDGIVDNPDTDGDGVPDVVDPTPTGGPPPPPGGGGGTGGGGGGGTGTAGGGSTPPTNDCSSSASAPLTGSFGADPCPLAEDTLNMVDSRYWDVGGTQFVDHLKKLWTDEMLPSMKNMTAQWNASVIDQTRQFGTTVDSHDMTKQIKQVQTREIEAKKRAMPNERSCVGATPVSALTMTASASTNFAKGIQESMDQRSGGAPGTPAEKGPVAVTNDKLKKYCEFFKDTDANAGADPCANIVPPIAPTANPWVNGDLDVEGFLLKDTIYMDKPEELEASKALLANLIEPDPPRRLTDDVLSTGAGHEYIIRNEQIEAWRNISYHVVAAMISRRTSMPLPQTAGGDTGPPPPPPPPPPPTTPGAPQQSRGTYAQFLQALGQRESSGKWDVCNNIGYCGLYQMGRAALIEAGCISAASGAQSSGTPQNQTQPNYNWVRGPQCPCGGSMAEFRGVNPQANTSNCQTLAITEYHRKLWGYINGGARAKACTLTTSPPSLQAGFWLTPSGMLAGAHLVGQGGVNCFVNGWGGAGCPAAGVASCPPGRGPGSLPCDGNRTPITQYMQTKGGYDFPQSPVQCGPMAGDPVTGTPASVSTGLPPPPPRPVKDTIAEIRRRAGVDVKLISDAPSYNEIMLAMTKERFLDPDYYARMGNQIGALKQEQASVKAYIAMQLQDIYLLQEQINLLMAARASMKLNEGSTGQQDQMDKAPIAP